MCNSDPPAAALVWLLPADEARLVLGLAAGHLVHVHAVVARTGREATGWRWWPPLRTTRLRRDVTTRNLLRAPGAMLTNEM